jgi:DNA-binding response OmpR family regulator
MRGRNVLCVSFDMAVSDIRSAALKEAGYAVTTTINAKEALDLLSREKFDLVIVGHRFAAADKYLLTVEAEEKANVPVLLVCGASADKDIPAAGRVYALEGTAGIVSAAAALLSERVGGALRAAA